MRTETAQVGEAAGPRVLFDTTFVLFFLAMEAGQSLSTDFASTVSLATLAAVVVLPFYLGDTGSKSILALWIAERSLIAIVALVLGIIFSQAIGPLLPESFGHLPLALLIIAAFFSFYVRFYSIMRFRLAR
ncbi:MAG: hypothetical protein LC730_05880 [Acidobacteria bacterium]|nr:hypothetical protein [Acidobacteriota bacterium]MCA1608969.1 hypothetical protein [Acidobacteriota bacterium]